MQTTFATIRGTTHAVAPDETTTRRHVKRLHGNTADDQEGCHCEPFEEGEAILVAPVPQA
jgi:hypothetical protein